MNTAVAGVQSTVNAINTLAAGSLDNTNSIRQTVNDNRGVILTIEAAAEAINTKVNDIQPKVSNIQFVLGTERPVDNNFGNGAHPVAFWAFNAWNNIVGARDVDLRVIRGDITNLGAQIIPDLNNIQFVLGTERPVDTRFNNGAHPVSFWAFHGWGNAVGAQNEAEEARRRADKVATIAERICDAIQSSPISGFRCST